MPCYARSRVVKGKRGTGQLASKVIKCVLPHYEVQDVEMGKVYRWRPQSVVVECEADHRPVVKEVLEAHPDEEEEEFDHPWRSPRPYYSPTRGT